MRDSERQRERRETLTMTPRGNTKRLLQERNFFNGCFKLANDISSRYFILVLVFI